MFYYIKRMGFITIMIVLMSLAASLVGMVVAVFIGGLFYRIENTFFRDFLIKLPMFILYLSFGYKMIVRYGFMDSQRKIYNMNFKILSVMIALIMMLPGTVHDSFFCVSALNSAFVNVQTVFSPNIGIYIVEDDGFFYLNESFSAGNVVLIILTILLSLAIQLGVFWFAYGRGKKIFIAQHIREIDYEMDENI